MAVIEESAIWVEIDRSEKYLICSMYEEAASLAYSILKNLLNSEVMDAELQFELMKESAAMVLVQSLHYLGRTAQIVNELKLTFDAIQTIPVQVVLTGVCLQISEGSLSGIREFLEEFSNTWSYMDKVYYILAGEVQNASCMENSVRPPVLEFEKYLKVVEVHVVTLIGNVLNDRDTAISWVEKAALPEENRQAFLCRLSSLCSLETTSSSDSSSLLPKADSVEGQLQESYTYLRHLLNSLSPSSQAL